MCPSNKVIHGQNILCRSFNILLVLLSFFRWPCAVQVVHFVLYVIVRCWCWFFLLHLDSSILKQPLAHFSLQLAIIIRIYIRLFTIKHFNNWRWITNQQAKRNARDRIRNLSNAFLPFRLIVSKDLYVRTSCSKS